MNPQMMANEYEDFQQKLLHDRAQLDEFNLGRLDEALYQVILFLGNLIDECRSFR